MRLIGLILLILSVFKIITIGLFYRNESYSTDYSTFFGLDVDQEQVMKGLIWYSAIEGALGITCGLYVSAF